MIMITSFTQIFSYIVKEKMMPPLNFNLIQISTFLFDLSTFTLRFSKFESYVIFGVLPQKIIRVF